MNIKATAELVVVILTALSFVFGAYMFLDSRHAHEGKILEVKKAILEVKLDLKEEAASDQLKQDAAAAAYYRQVERTEGLELTVPEQDRKDFVERRVVQKQRELDMIDLQQARLEQLEVTE